MTISLPLGLRALRHFEFPHKLGLLDRLYGRALERRGICWVKTASGPVWKLDLRSNSQRWIVYGDYEGPVFLGWARRWLARGGVVVDSGANIGQTVLYFAALPGCQVYAFEPNPPSAAWLRECLAMQNWNVEVIEEGLSDQRSDMTLRIPDFSGEQAAQATLQTGWYKTVSTRATSIVVDTLDAFIERRAIARVRLWKLDVEGWEMAALRGAERSLRRNAIDAIFVEMHPDNGAEAKRFLELCGYRVHRLSHRGLGPYDGCDVTVNLIALPTP
jgi:FkbM family methyltransferase